MMLPPMGFLGSAENMAAPSTWATTWLVITTATPYCTHQITAPHDDKNHTRWSSPLKHSTTNIKPVLSDDKTTLGGYHHCHTVLHTSNHSSYTTPVVITTTTQYYKYQTSPQWWYNHTTWLSLPPHHIANIKPQLLWWYKPHHLVITTATPYCKHQTTALMMIQTTPPGYHHHHTTLQTSNHNSCDDTNHTSWSSPLPHHTAHVKPQSPMMTKTTPAGHHTTTLYCTLKGCQPVSDSCSNVLISIPHQPA